MKTAFIFGGLQSFIHVLRSNLILDLNLNLENNNI